MPSIPRRIAVVTCYRQPDYVRAVTLRRAAAESGSFDEVIVVKNRSAGLARYLEVTRSLLALRGENRPDAYLVTFRGYEILAVVLALAGGRPVYYDEFINPVEWFVEEHAKLRPGSLAARAMKAVFRRLMRRTAAILTDTASHADHSAELMSIDRRRYYPVPVGTDEHLFSISRSPERRETLRVLFYGGMLPLHGLPVLLDAAIALRDNDRIEFVLVGGGDAEQETIVGAQRAGARVEYHRWVDFDALPALIAGCDVMLGGPFGDTVQSRYVITGKTYQFLASGMPTIVGRNRETGVFSDRGDSFVVTQGDPGALADTLSWAFEHRDRLPAIGRAGRALFEREFSAKVVADRLRRAFAEHPGEVQSARDEQQHAEE